MLQHHHMVPVMQVDGKFVLTRVTTKGPSNLGDWERGWALFSAAALMTGIMSPSALSGYLKGIRQLTLMFGNWPVVHHADE